MPIPDPERIVHLQFRRFAGCPICNLHLREIVRRHDEIEAAGVREVVVFHSTAAELAEYDLPFAVIADPEKGLYREYGVEASPRALLHPRVYGRSSAPPPAAPSRSCVAARKPRSRASPAAGWACPPTS